MACAALRSVIEPQRLRSKVEADSGIAAAAAAGMSNPMWPVQQCSNAVGPHALQAKKMQALARRSHAEGLLGWTQLWAALADGIRPPARLSSQAALLLWTLQGTAGHPVVQMCARSSCGLRKGRARRVRCGDPGQTQGPAGREANPSAVVATVQRLGILARQKRRDQRSNADRLARRILCTRCCIGCRGRQRQRVATFENASYRAVRSKGRQVSAAYLSALSIL
jgi:hypothetical protein